MGNNGSSCGGNYNDKKKKKRSDRDSDDSNISNNTSKEYVPKHGHGIRRSNSDIFNSHILGLCEKKDDIIDGNYVERLGNEKMSRVYQKSDSFSFSIDTGMQDIRSNRSSNTLYEQDEMVRCVSIGQHDKSGSDMTVISVSNTTISRRHNNDIVVHIIIMIYLNMIIMEVIIVVILIIIVLHLQMYYQMIPHTQIPTFIEGYEKHTDSANILNNSNKKVNNKIVNDIPSTEYMKLNMQSRNSEKYLEDLGLMKQSLVSPVNSNGCKETENKLTDHVSIPDTDYDSQIFIYEIVMYLFIDHQ